MKSHIHYGASKRIFINAKALRSRQTFAEKLLWSKLRNNQLGYHFRRQHPMLEFVVDFYCEQLKLVIEVDGSVHLDPTVQIEDEYKDNSIQAYGMDLIRFTNEQVINNIDSVVELIKQQIVIIENKLKTSGH